MKRQIFNRKIGVIAGAGVHGGLLDSLFENPRIVSVDTPFHDQPIAAKVGTIKGIQVIFVPRHGWHYEYPSHRVNYRANMFALKKLGVDVVIAFLASGGLSTNLRVGDLVLLDSFIDLTKTRLCTYYDLIPVFIPMADPYDSVTRNIILRARVATNQHFHKYGAYSVEGDQ
jgi:5'-methylthioadenosine phosphorylase